MSEQRVLIVDDDREVAEFVATVAGTCGLEAVVAADHRRFEDDYRAHRPAVVVTDLQMPGLDGVEVLRFLALDGSRAKVILMSGFDARVIASARRLGASLGLDVVGEITKPIAVTALQALFRKAVRAARTVTETELAAAIRAGELVLHYQPKVSLVGENAGAVIGVEALARWNHPELGLLPPADFIPLAEGSDLVVLLTDALADVAIGQARRWLEGGLELSIALNITPRALDTLSFPDRLEQRARDAGCSPSQFVLEITETGAMQESVAIVDILTRLRLKGFGLSIDDFGTGYSSLVQLHRMPFSELKVDRSFVMELEESDEARVIVRAVVELAHNLSLSVCAEGIESELAWNFMRDLGCEKAQGYLIAKPMPPDRVPGWIDSWRVTRARGADGAAKSVP